MVSKINGFFSGGWFFAVILVLQAIVLLIAPNEKTIGSGIKPVYLHVSLTWAGMIFFLIAGILGLFITVFNKKRVAVWFRGVYLTAAILYLVGFLVSLYASWLNWGGIPFQEPRIRNAINVVVVSIAVWIFTELVSNIRLQGLTGILPFLFILFSRGSDRMVLHPENPVSTAPQGIRTTFGMMFVLALLLAIWVLGQALKLYTSKSGKPSASVPQAEIKELRN
jgi:hypothetical protein